eukprot:7381962-Prymnesium_polylepis.2
MHMYSGAGRVFTEAQRWDVPEIRPLRAVHARVPPFSTARKPRVGGAAAGRDTTKVKDRKVSINYRGTSPKKHRASRSEAGVGARWPSKGNI